MKIFYSSVFIVLVLASLLSAPAYSVASDVVQAPTGAASESQPIKACLDAVTPTIDFATASRSTLKSFKTQDKIERGIRLANSVLVGGVSFFVSTWMLIGYDYDLNAYREMWSLLGFSEVPFDDFITRFPASRIAFPGLLGLFGACVGNICTRLYRNASEHYNDDDVITRLREFAYRTHVALPADARFMFPTGSDRRMLSYLLYAMNKNNFVWVKPEVGSTHFEPFQITKTPALRLLHGPGGRHIDLHLAKSGAMGFDEPLAVFPSPLRFLTPREHEVIKKGFADDTIFSSVDSVYVEPDSFYHHLYNDRSPNVHLSVDEALFSALGLTEINLDRKPGFAVTKDFVVEVLGRQNAAAFETFRTYGPPTGVYAKLTDEGWLFYLTLSEEEEAAPSLSTREEL